MKYSTKIFLFGLCCSIILIGACLYFHLDKLVEDTEESHFIEVSTDETPPKVTEAETITSPPSQVKKVVTSTDGFLLEDETNDSSMELKPSSLLYEIKDEMLTIDGDLPILEDSDRFKQIMMRQCKNFSCNRKILFSANQSEPDWRELAMAVIGLFEQERLGKALLLIENNKILVGGEFNTTASKSKLDRLLEGYMSIYDINNTTTLKTTPTPVSTPTPEVKQIAVVSKPSKSKSPNNEDNEEANATTPLAKIQEEIATLLKQRPINFHRNRARITRRGKRTLREIIKLLKTLPDAKIEVRGYTDAGGKARINKWLSTQRAKSVKNYLGSHGLNPKNITAKGFGETELLLKDRPYSVLNRRVEIVIKKEK